MIVDRPATGAVYSRSMGRSPRPAGPPGFRHLSERLAFVNDWLEIQQSQRQVVDEDPLSVLSAAVDLPRADVIHLNVEGYKTIGARVACFYSLPVAP